MNYTDNERVASSVRSCMPLVWTSIKGGKSDRQAGLPACVLRKRLSQRRSCPVCTTA